MEAYLHRSYTALASMNGVKYMDDRVKMTVYHDFHLFQPAWKQQ